jgi:hypothetical protein
LQQLLHNNNWLNCFDPMEKQSDRGLLIYPRA